MKAHFSSEPQILTPTLNNRVAIVGFLGVAFTVMAISLLLRKQSKQKSETDE